jgi:LysM repeat protein
MLAGQRSNINAAMPEGMRTAYTREPLRDASREPAYETERYPRRAETHTKPSASWVLPALLGLGLLGLLWYGVSRSAVRAGRDEGAVAERTARMHETYRQKGMASFESLKSKYQSVIQEARNQGIQISKLQEKDGKLLIEGTAPSTEAANRVWNEIKRIDPNMQGIIANFPVSTSVGFIPKMPSTTGETASQAADTTAANTKSADNTKADTSKNAVTRAKPGLSDTMTASDKETYTVKRGDTLGTISKHFYGDSKEYKRILDANSDSINNANQLEVGQQLQIPMK